MTGTGAGSGGGGGGHRRLWPGVPALVRAIARAGADDSRGGRRRWRGRSPARRGEAAVALIWCIGARSSEMKWPGRACGLKSLMSDGMSDDHGT